MKQICYRKSDASFWNYDVWQGEYAKNKNILYVWFPINRENISNHPFCLIIELNGLKEGHYLNDIAPKDSNMCLEVSF